MRKIYSEPSFISISLNVDLNFNSLDVFFFSFSMILQGRFLCEFVCVVVVMN